MQASEDERYESLSIGLSLAMKNTCVQEHHFDSHSTDDYAGPNLTPLFNKEVVRSAIRKNSNVTRVLDFGCGNGKYGYTEYLLREGFQVSFTDISRISVAALAGRLSAMNISFDKCHAGEIHDLKRPEMMNYFDTVVFGDVLHHLTFDDTASILSSLKGLLKKNGEIVAIEPNGSCPIWRLMPLYNKEFIWEVEKNIRYCTKQCLTKKFTDAGFRIVRYEYIRMLPIYLVGNFRLFRILDRFLVSLPIVNRLSQYSLIVARQSDSES